jgi:hypothetical protein
MTQKTQASYQDNIFRYDQYQIIASNRHLASIKAVKTNSVLALLPGTILARVPADGLHKEYSTISGTAGIDSFCVLLDNLNDVEASGISVVKAVFGGEVYETALINLTAGSRTGLGGKSIIDGAGTAIYKF